MDLYTISARYEQLFNLEEYTPEQLQELETLFHSIQDEIVKRIMYIKNLEGCQIVLNEEIKRLTDRKETLENKIERQKIFLKNRMEHAKIEKVDHAIFPVKLAKNPEKVDIFNADLLPTDYIIIKETFHIDKTLIKEDIKKGIDIPGVKLVRDSRLVY